MKAKDKLIQIRALDRDKELIKKAADKEEVSLSSFMLEASVSKAKRTLNKKDK